MNTTSTAATIASNPFLSQLQSLSNTLYGWVVAAILIFGALIIGWIFFKGQLSESDDSGGMESKKHINRAIRVVLWTIAGEMATTIFHLLIK